MNLIALETRKISIFAIYLLALIKFGPLVLAQPEVTNSEPTANQESLPVKQQQQQPQSNNGNGNLIKFLNQEEPSSVNLKSVLEHEEALRAECMRIYNDKVKQMKLVLASDNLHLAKPTIKIPAICLYLINDFIDGQEPEEGSQAFGEQVNLVNWILDEQELNDTQQMNKREVGQNSDGKQSVNYLDDDNSQLKDFLFNPSMEVSSNHDQSMNEIDEEIGKIINNDKFKDAISSSSDYREKISANLSPVILVPGLLGSRLQAKFSKKNKVNIFCSKQQDWEDMWLSLRKLLPVAVDCWLDNVRLEYDPVSGFSKLPAGVEARVPDFGSVDSVRYLDVNQPKMTSYMAPLVDKYEQLGYIADYNLLAAPYDFRLAPQELGPYFASLRQLIDKAALRAYKARTANNRKVTLVCHSMGCTQLLIFLRLQSPAWRQSKIRKLIALSSPWGGSMKALKAFVVGDQLELPLISEAKMRKLARTYPSIAFLLPQMEVFSKSNKNQISTDNATDKILVETPERVYHLSEMRDLFINLNLTVQWQWFEQTTSLIQPYNPLNDVKVDCIHSLNIPTPETLIFQKQADFPNGQYVSVKGDGDGTVNLESLLVCAEWANQLPEMVKHITIMNTNHIGVLSHKVTLDHITEDAYL